MSLGSFFWFLVLWAFAYPFIYGQGIIRAFGLNKAIDNWIVVVLHMSVGTLAGVLCFIWGSFFINNLIWTLIIFFVILFLVEGLIIELFLLDKKINGFLISLICNVIYIIPIIFAFGSYGLFKSVFK